MTVPSLFAFNSCADYLTAYFQYKAELNKRFNYTVWSKQLKFNNVAMLSRVLRGTRPPGPKVSAALCDYFQFSNDEREYFLTMVRLSKEADPGIRSICKKRLESLRQGGTATPPLVEAKAQNLNLWGSADPSAFDEYLGQFGFENIQAYAGAASSVCLSSGYIVKSILGPFSQFSFASYVKRKGTALKTSELFYGKIYSSDQNIVDQYNVWGSPYEYSQMHWKLDQADADKHFALTDGQVQALEVKFGTSPIPLVEANQPNDVLGYNTLWGAERFFKISFNSTAYCRPFDPTVDRCDWKIDSELGHILTKIGFRPLYWTYHPELDATVFPHESHSS